jgi:uncharacterized protein YqhQ
VGYLLVVSRAPDIRRVFQYHGAEHMTIHALEHDDPLVISEVRKYPTAHPRCGTEFLVVFVVVNILAFSIVSTFVGGNVLATIASRVLLIPVIASVSYEILRFGAKHRDNRVIRWIFMPGIWVQMISTKQPEDGMIEVAIASMREALAINGEEAPAGSLDPERRRLSDVEAAAGAGTGATDEVALPAAAPLGRSGDALER